MKKNHSKFSLIDLLLVIVIVGVIAAVAVPSLLRTRQSSGNASAYSSMRSLSTLQSKYYSQNSRFGKLEEIVSDQNSDLGTLSGGTLTKGSFNFVLEPGLSDDQLKTRYKFVATRPGLGGQPPYILEIDQTGQ